MKKALFAAICFLLIIVSGCKNSSISENNTTTTYNSTVSSTNISAPTETPSFEETAFWEQTQTTSNEHSTIKETSVKNTNSNTPYPDNLRLNIGVLKDLKSAIDTMDDDEFSKYLKTVERNQYTSVWFESIDTAEEIRNLLAEIENTYVAVLDTVSNDDVSFIYYFEEKRIFQSVSYTENLRFAFDFYVSGEPTFLYSTVINTDYVTSVEINSVKADIHKSESRAGFCVDAVFDGQKFTFRVTEEQTLEEFEETFSRLKFVKIGDLINS